MFAPKKFGSKHDIITRNSRVAMMLPQLALPCKVVIHSECVFFISRGSIFDFFTNYKWGTQDRIEPYLKLGERERERKRRRKKWQTCSLSRQSSTQRVGLVILHNCLNSLLPRHPLTTLHGMLALEAAKLLNL